MRRKSPLYFAFWAWVDWQAQWNVWVLLGRCESFRQATGHIFSCFKLSPHNRPHHPLHSFIATVLALKGLMSSRPGCFGHLHQGSQVNISSVAISFLSHLEDQYREVEILASFRWSSVLSVKWLSLCDPSVLIHSALPSDEHRNPTQGLGAGLQMRSGHTGLESQKLNSEGDSLHDPCRQKTSFSWVGVKADGNDSARRKGGGRGVNLLLRAKTHYCYWVIRHVFVRRVWQSRVLDLASERGLFFSEE